MQPSARPDGRSEGCWRFVADSASKAGRVSLKSVQQSKTVAARAVEAVGAV